MKFVSLLHVLSFIGSGYACGGHHDEKEWSSEELAELEAKWGHEVCPELISMLITLNHSHI